MRISFLLVIGFALTACGGADDEAVVAAPVEAPVDTGPQINTDPSSSYEEAREAAVAAVELAAAKGHAWNVTDTLIKNAAKAAADGDEASAILLADEARFQAQLAVIQADREVDAWRNNVIGD